MEIKVKYNNGKLFSNNKDIILNNLADIYEITQNEPCALSTKIFYGIIKDVDGKKRIFLIVPVRSLVDDDVIYLYFFGKHTRHWHRLDKFTDTRTIFDSYNECVDFYMKTESGASVCEVGEKSIAEKLLDEVDEKSREEASCKNFNEMVERVKKIEECRKLTDEIAKLKAAMKNAETHFKFADEDYNKILDEYRTITKEFERRKSAWESAKKVKEQYAKKFEELDNRRAELDAEIKAESCDVSTFWDVFLHQCFGE